MDLLGGRENRRYGTETAILFKIEEYYNTSTIFDFGVITGTDDANVLKGKSSLFDKELIIADEYRIYRGDDEEKKPSRLTVKFGAYPSAEMYVRKPLGLVQGLAKIGGFLGFMKLFSLFLSLAHQYMFDKELRKSL